MRHCVFVGLILFSISLRAQETNTIDFSLLRQNDNITIEDPQNFYEKIKAVSLGQNSTLSFGGSYRFQTEAFINEQFDSSLDQTDYWFLNRFMLHAHLKLGDRFEFFSELNSSLITSKDNLVPVDRDELSFNQLFFKFRFTDNWEVMVGRQNMRLGSGRLVDIREGPNVRLSFDMAQLEYKDSNTTITAFHAIPVVVNQGIFDNDLLVNNETLSALYWTQNWTENTNTDLYLLYKTEEAKTWNVGTADDDRASLGLRHFGSWNDWNYNNEFVFQFGSFGDENISAWTVSFNIEKEVSFGAIGIKTEAISGDDNESGSLNTFDGLYPRGAYFGRVARFGPSNLIDFHPYVETSFGEFNVQFDYVSFWRYSIDDGLYNPALILDYPDLNDERFIGHQFGGIVSHQLNEFIGFELESNVIFPGGFLEESGLSDTLYHFVFTTEIKF